VAPSQQARARDGYVESQCLSERVCWPAGSSLWRRRQVLEVQEPLLPRAEGPACLWAAPSNSLLPRVPGSLGQGLVWQRTCGGALLWLGRLGGHSLPTPQWVLLARGERVPHPPRCPGGSAPGG